MLRAIRDIFESLRTPTKRVFFHSLPFNRRALFWYANRVVSGDSVVENVERLKEIEELRLNGNPITFLCNHLTYADSHIIETLFMRSGYRRLADRVIHIAGQKTFEIYRRFMTRSLNTIRVYQPKAKVDTALRRRMNLRALKWAAHLKNRGYSLLVFPEGTRTRRHSRFNLLAANPRIIAYLRHSYVVPLGLMGAEAIMPVGRFRPHNARVRLRVGPPSDFRITENIYKEEHSHQNDADVRRGLVLHYMKQINDLLDPDYRDSTAQAEVS
jgi:1-acyl-sn-glycerol-3-phosphate acyltransferase